MSPFPRQLRWYAAAVFGAAVVAAVLLALREPAPSVGALFVFGALTVFAAQLQVRVAEGVDVTPGLMVAMASIVVFAHGDSLLGAMLVCALAPVKVTDFHRAGWGWVPFNVGICGLSFLACAAVYDLLPAADSGSPLRAVVAIVPLGITYLAVAWGLLLVSYAIEGNRPWREVLRELVPAGVEVIPPGVVGLLLGRLYLSLGPAVLLLVIVPILIAREMFASYMRVKDAHDETVALLISALEQKDPYTAGHAERVAQYAHYIAEELDFMPARAERLRFAALMHDIGKLVVPNQLLNKPGKLTEAEYARVRVHEGVSVQMLSHIDFLRPIAADTHSENMRFDPDNPDHPIEPYIIMIADAYDAMTSTRSYRKALSQEVAFQELRDKSGTQFHPESAEALIHAIEKRHEVHGKGHEEELHFENAPEVGLGSAGLGDLDQSKQSGTVPTEPAGT